jgi:epoxyqueuosine reductase
VPGARSVLCVADRYADGRPDRREPGLGRIARYSRGEDYHVVIRARLEAFVQELARLWPGQRLRVCVDTAPLLEREHAERAGVGRIGKHTLLIAPGGIGSWVLLGAVISTVELAPIRADGSLAPPAGEGDARDPALDPCGSCTRCLTACPTHAITAPFQLDARRCISYLTIELKGAIPVELRPAIGNRIYGCDDCLAACPWNRFAREGSLMKAHAREDLRTPDLIELLRLDEAGFKSRFAGSPIRRTKRRGLLRNVCVALGNSGDPGALPDLERATRNSEPLVAEHAQWAIERIRHLQNHPAD